MGQKVNSIIFRQPFGNPQSTLWFSKFDRYSQFLSQDLEIRRFLTFLLERKGIILKSTKLERTSQQIVLNLDLYFSIFLTKRSKAVWATSLYKKLKAKFKPVKRLKYVRPFMLYFDFLSSEDDTSEIGEESSEIREENSEAGKEEKKVIKIKKVRRRNVVRRFLLAKTKRRRFFGKSRKDFNFFKNFFSQLKNRKLRRGKKISILVKKILKFRKRWLKVKRRVLSKKLKGKNQKTSKKDRKIPKKIRKSGKVRKANKVQKILVKKRLAFDQTLSYERRLLFFIIFKQRKKYLFKRKTKVSILSVLKKSFTPKLLRMKIFKFRNLLRTHKFIYNFHRFNCVKALKISKRIKSLTFLKLNKFLCEFLQRFTGIEQIKIRFFSSQLKFLPLFQLFKKKFRRRLFFYKRNKSFTPYFKESLEILFLAFSMFSFGNAMLLTKVIGRLLQTNRRQITVIKFLKKAMAIFFRKLPAKFSSLNGIRITIVGRFNKRPRTKTFVLQQGQLCLQTLSMPIDFHYTQVVTLFGSFGVKVWLSKKIKEKKRVE